MMSYNDEEVAHITRKMHDGSHANLTVDEFELFMEHEYLIAVEDSNKMLDSQRVLINELREEVEYHRINAENAVHPLLAELNLDLKDRDHITGVLEQEVMKLKRHNDHLEHKVITTEDGSNGTLIVAVTLVSIVVIILTYIMITS